MVINPASSGWVVAVIVEPMNLSLVLCYCLSEGLRLLFLQSKEDFACHKAVRPSLMSDTYSVNPQHVRNAIQSSSVKHWIKNWHNGLKIVHIREEDLDEFEELLTGLWKIFIHHYLEVVGKIVTSMKAYPMYSFVQD